MLSDAFPLGERYTPGLARYVRDNPLAMVAGALIIGVLLARFAFLGNPKDEKRARPALAGRAIWLFGRVPEYGEDCIVILASRAAEIGVELLGAEGGVGEAQ